jgi:3-oxoacyl-[acyl-carrier protein] reductase
VSDSYLNFANSKVGNKLFSVLGLPRPVSLKRGDDASAHHISGDILFGSSGDSAFGHAVKSALSSPEINLITGDPGGKTVNMIYDASGIATAEQSSQLYEFFHQNLSSLSRCGRVIVIGHKPSALQESEHATLQRGLVGFVKSLAKEVGRKGATVNLMFVDPGGEVAITAPLRFLLSAGSTFLNAQILTASAPVNDLQGDWQRPLVDRHVVVTGAARGIGLSISQTLARDGATVIGIDVPQSETDLKSAMDAIGGHALPLDITGQDAPDRLLEFCAQHTQKLHGIIHNAGITRDKMLSRMNSQQWDMLMQVNLGSVQRINKALLATEMLDAGGKIVGIASISGIAGNVGQTNYGFSKAAVIGMVETLAQSCAARGITINGVAPGFIETQMTAAIPFLTRQIGRRLSSLGQGGLPVDVAEVIAFFLSPQAAGINGNVVRVCGQSLLGA